MTLIANFIFNPEQFRSEITPDEFKQYYEALCLLRDDIKNETHEQINILLIDETHLTKIFKEITDYIQDGILRQREFIEKNKSYPLDDKLIRKFCKILNFKQYCLSKLSMYSQLSLIESPWQQADKCPMSIQGIINFVYATMQKILADEDEIRDWLLALFNKKLCKYNDPNQVCTSSSIFPSEISQYYDESAKLINILNQFFNKNPALFMSKAEINYAPISDKNFAAGKDVLMMLEKDNFEQFFKFILFGSIEKELFGNTNKNIDIENLNIIAKYPIMIADGFFNMALESFYWLKNSKDLIPFYDLNSDLIKKLENQDTIISLMDFLMPVEYVLNEYENCIKQEHYFNVELISNNLSLPQKYLLLCRMAQKMNFYITRLNDETGDVYANISFSYLEKFIEFLPQFANVDFNFIFAQMPDMMVLCCMLTPSLLTSNNGLIVKELLSSSQFIHNYLNQFYVDDFLKKHLDVIASYLDNVNEDLKNKKFLKEDIYQCLYTLLGLVKHYKKILMTIMIENQTYNEMVGKLKTSVELINHHLIEVIRRLVSSMKDKKTSGSNKEVIANFFLILYKDILIIPTAGFNEEIVEKIKVGQSCFEFFLVPNEKVLKSIRDIFPKINEISLTKLAKNIDESNDNNKSSIKVKGSSCDLSFQSIDDIEIKNEVQEENNNIESVINESATPKLPNINEQPISHLPAESNSQYQEGVRNDSNESLFIIEQVSSIPSESRSLKKAQSFYGQSTLFHSFKSNNNLNFINPIKYDKPKLTHSQSFFCGSGDAFLKTASIYQSRVFDDIYPCVVEEVLYEWHAYRYVYTPSLSCQDDNSVSAKTKTYSYQFQLAINGVLNARDWYELHFKTKLKLASEEKSFHHHFSGVIGIKNYLKRKLGGKKYGEPVTYNLDDLTPVMIKTKESSLEFRGENDFNYYALSRKLVELFFKRYCNNGIIHAYIDEGRFIPDRDADKIPQEKYYGNFKLQ